MYNVQEHVYFFSLYDFPIGKSIEPLVRQYDNDGTYKAKIENVLEEKRQSLFAEYPSRLKCTFVAPTEQSANEWFKSLKTQLWQKHGYHLEYYIYKLVCSTSIYWFNADTLMQIVIDKDKSIEEIAEEYWSSCSTIKPQSTTSDQEGLVNGLLSIVSKKKYLLDKNRKYEEIALEFQ